MATTEDLVRISGQSHEIIKRVGNDSLEASDVRRAYQDIIEGRISQPDAAAESEFASILTPTGFTPVELQVAQFRQWNRLLGLGSYFSDQQIHEALVSAPAFAWDRPLVAVTLCWTMNTLGQTIDFYLAAMRLVYGKDKVYVSPDFNVDADHTTLVEGAPEFVPNRLSWVVTDLGANRDKSPDEVPPATAAGLEVFAATCQHKANVRHHNGSGYPYWDVPGIRVKVEGESEPCAPSFFWYSSGEVLVVVCLASDAIPDYSEPVRE